MTHAKPVWDDGDVTTTDLRDCLLKNVSGEIIAQSSTNDPDKQGISLERTNTIILVQVLKLILSMAIILGKKHWHRIFGNLERIISRVNIP